MEARVKELFKEYLEGCFKKVRVNGIEPMYDMMKGMDTIHVFAFDTTMTDFLDNKTRGTFYISYNWKGFLDSVSWPM